MPQESPPNGNNKSKQRFSGRRRSYVDTFRWGFVSEEEGSDNVAQKPSPVKPERKDGSRQKQRPLVPQEERVREGESYEGGNSPHSSPLPKGEGVMSEGPDSAPKSKRNRPRKKSAELVMESVIKPQSVPKGKSSGNDSVKHSTKTPAGHLPKQPVPGKHPPKRKGRTKVVLPPYVADDGYDENDEDLKLPSYGRTPIPTDDELPVPKNVRQGNVQKLPSSKKTEGTTDAVSDVSSVGFRPRREQMVWDPERQEYVPLVTVPKPESSVSKKLPKHAVSPKSERPSVTHIKPDKRQERTEKPIEKPTGKSQDTSSPKPPKQPKQKRQQPHPKPKKTESLIPQREDELTERPPRYGDSRRGDVSLFIESPQPDPADIESEVSGFAELGVSEAMLEALKIVRYLEPTPIQAGVFQKVQAGVDLMGQAQTGTGKTAAFSMPIIEGVETCPPGNDPVALILVPTRELAVQVRDEAIRLAYGRDIHITACYGGKPLAKQIERLKNGIDILVGTPGRILDLMNRRALSLDSIRWVILDEADRMLDIGFRPDIEKILKRTPQDRQTLLFSATLPAPVIRLAEKYMKSPEVLDFSNKSVAVETIDQYYVTVDPERKFDALVYLLQEQQPQQAIIFTRTKRGADRLARLLANRFEKLAAIHGDLQQSERDSVMARVRAGSLKYLVATDVVGRGIDVSGISHIINYDIPKFCDDYVHRVGRTGRMGREGVAFTFVTVQEGSELTRIEMRIDKLLKRAELKGFESFTKPHDPNASLDDDLQPEPPKPIFGKHVRKVRRAL